MKTLLRFSLSLCFLSIVSLSFAQSDMKNYLGEYTVEEGPFSTIKVTLENGKLMGEAVGQGYSELGSSDEVDVFNVIDYDGEITFLRDDKKIVNALELFINGSTISAKRKLPELTDFEGNFIFSDGPVSELYFEPEDGILMAEASETGRGPVDATSNLDQFYGATYQSDIVFSRNDEGVVDSVFISVQGMTLEGAKEMDEVIESPYVGNYEFEAGSPVVAVEVYEKDGVLYGASDQGEAELKPTDRADVFEVVGYDGEAVFQKDDMGKITGMVLTIQGTELIAEKSE